MGERDARERAEQADQRARDREHETMLQRERLAAEKTSEERKLVADQFSEERNLRLETTKLFTDVYKAAAANNSPVDMSILSGSLQRSSQSVMMLCSQPGQGPMQFLYAHPECLTQLSSKVEPSVRPCLTQPPKVEAAAVCNTPQHVAHYAELSTTPWNQMIDV